MKKIKKVVKELKDVSGFVEYYAQWEDDYSEMRSKLIDIFNAIDYFLDEYSKK